MKKYMNYDSNIQDVEKINPLFSKCKIHVMYEGINRNKTYFEREDIINALHSMKYAPIVGRYIEDTENFGAHDMELQFKDGDIVFKYLTKPLGVISGDSEPYWETKLDKDGVEREYLTVDGYLWNRYEEEVNTLTENIFNHSMEIEVGSTEDIEIDGEKYVKIKDFLFSGFCILGINKDGEGHVEPCFEGSDISVYNFNKDQFKFEFNEMVKELKDSLNLSNKEVENLTIEELLEKYSLKIEDLSAIESYESLSTEELEAKLQEIYMGKEKCSECGEGECTCTSDNPETDPQPEPDAVDPEPTPDSSVEDKFSRVFELSHDDVRRKMYEKIDSHMQTQGQGGWWYINKVFQTYFITSDDGYPTEKFFKVAYSIENDEVTLGDTVEVFPMFLTAEEKASVEGMQTNFSALEEEVTELREFKAEKLKEKHESDVQSILAQEVFSILDTEEVTPIVEKQHEMTIEQIQSKLFELVGRKAAQGQFSLKKDSKKEDKGLITLGVDAEEVDSTPRSKYADLIEKHIKK